MMSKDEPEDGLDRTTSRDTLWGKESGALRLSRRLTTFSGSQRLGEKAGHSKQTILGYLD